VAIEVRRESDLAGVAPAAWNALGHAPSPFLEHGFLRALERSGSVGRVAGWEPHYLLAEEVGRGGRELVGAVVAYVKWHSYGEYIFDWGWADAAARAGIAYYPKLVIAAPMTPATGRRLLVAPGADEPAVCAALLAAVRALADARGCSSIHWLFPTAAEHALLADHGYAPRASFQFHFRNPGHRSFDEFLAALASRKRKQVRKERERARAAVDELCFVDGAALDREQLDAIDRYYRGTVAAHGGIDYLQPGFFHLLAELMPERLCVSAALRGGRLIAGALFFETGHGLYGRYWGCDEDVPFLHFETAYYAAIERCIARGIPLLEAGAQGAHKLVRGFAPAATCSNHWLRHPGLAEAVQRFLRREAAAVARQMEQLNDCTPFRKG
jgi:hypothetical protein